MAKRAAQDSNIISRRPIRLAAFSVWSCFIVTRSIELITPLVEEEEEEEDGYKVKSIPMQ